MQEVKYQKIIKINDKNKQNHQQKNNLQHNKHKYTADEHDWKPLLQEHHKNNIPIYHESQDGTVTQILTVHIPKNLYIQKQYKRLNDHIHYYIKQFDKNCHGSVDRDQFHFAALESYQKQIKIGLQQISEQLAFLNLRQFADIIKNLNILFSRNHANFINFIKSTKRSRFIFFQNKGQCKNDLRSYCLDCKTHKQQIIIKQLKKKLNLNKIQEVVNIQQNFDGDEISKKIQAQVNKNYNKIKMTIKQSMQAQQRRQQILKQKKVKQQQLKLQIEQENDILIMQKQNYIQQVNALLAGRQSNLSSNTQTYSYLINQLMTFPLNNFTSKSQEEILKQTQKLADKIKKELFDNFLLTLSEPIKQVFKKLIKKNDFNQIHGLNYDNNVQNIIKCDVETQTSLEDYTKEKQKIQILQKMLQKKNHQLSSVKCTKQQLQRKYMEKYQELRQQQKDSYAKHKEIKRCYKQIETLREKIKFLELKIEQQDIQKKNQLKQFQIIHQNQIKQLKKKQEQKFAQYRYRMNQQVSKKIQQVKSEKNSEIQILRSKNTLSKKQVNQSQFQVNDFQCFNEDQLKESVKEQKSSKNKSALKKNQTLKTIVNKQVKLKQQSNIHTEGLFFNQNFISNKSQKSLGSRAYSQKSFKSIQKSDKQKKTEKLIKQQKSQSQMQGFNNVQNFIQNQKLKQSSQYFEAGQKSMIKIDFGSKSQSQKSIDLMIKHNNQFKRNYLSKDQINNNSSLFLKNISKSSQTPKYILNNAKNVFKITPKQFRTEQDPSQQFIKSFQTDSNKEQIHLSMNKTQRFFRHTDNPQFVKKQKFFEVQSQTCQASPQKIHIKKIKKIPVTKINQLKRSQNQRMNTIQQVQNTQIEGCQSRKSLQRQKQEKIESKKVVQKRKWIKLNKKTQQKKSVKFQTEQKQNLTSNNQSFKVSINQLEWNQKSSKQSKSSQRINFSNLVSKHQISTFSNIKKSSIKYLNPINQMSQEQADKFKSEIISKIEKQFNFLCQLGLIHIFQFIQNSQFKHFDQALKQKTQIKLLQKKRIKQSEQKQSSKNGNSKQSKTFRTLKAILIQNQSLNVSLNNKQVGINQMSPQKSQIYQRLTENLKKIQTLSEIVLQDFELFGLSQLGKIQVWQNMKVIEIGLDNKFNQQIKKIQGYFNYLFAFNKIKYLQYTEFLTKPLDFYYKITQRVVKRQKKIQQNSKHNSDNRQIQYIEMNKLRVCLYKIFKFHQTTHKCSCQHIQKFLKKVGYYKYSSFYGTKLSLQNSF